MAASPIVLTSEMRTLARDREPDRYLAALLAADDVRDALIVLAAFIAELKRIPDVVADPNLAEIRLAWWRDALTSQDGGLTGSPTADAMRAVIETFNLNKRALAEWLDAFAHTFYAAGPQDEVHLDLELALIEGTPFQFAAAICGAPESSDVFSACSSAGIAYGLARMALDFPRFLAHGRMPLPSVPFDPERPALLDQAAAKAVISTLGHSRLQMARSGFAALPAGVRIALLPLALVEPYLRASCRQDRDLTSELAAVAPLVRVWRIWRARMTGRV